jgi:hypothetical protein
MACGVNGCPTTGAARAKATAAKERKTRRAPALGQVAEGLEMVIMASVWGTRDVIVRVRVYTERPSG